MLSNVTVGAISDAPGRHKNSYPTVYLLVKKRIGPGVGTCRCGIREFISEITRGTVNHP